MNWADWLAISALLGVIPAWVTAFGRFSNTARATAMLLPLVAFVLAVGWGT